MYNDTRLDLKIELYGEFYRMECQKEKYVKRFVPDPENGLTASQVQSRINDSLVNFDTSVPTKSIKSIVKDNFFTLFNFLNLFLGLALLYVGSFKNMLFLGVVFSNVIIGTFQEINAKRVVDRLSIISSTKVSVIRDKKIKKISVNEIVLDDVMLLEQGAQIVSDCVIVSGECSVNESLVTGESDSISKKVGDLLLSGSYVVSGKCRARVEHVGDCNYASKISQEARYIKKVNSEIMLTFKKIILIVSILIVPVGTFLFAKQLNIEGNSFELAVVNTVAAVIGMIPEGLVLLTSTVLAVSVVRLSKHQVLVQELYCIETLARVDVLCLDKTGTITEGTMEVIDTVPTDSFSKKDIQNVMSNLVAALDDCNPTFEAMRQKFCGQLNKKIEKIYPFSSEKKWSGATFKDDYSYMIGAAEFILKYSDLNKIKSQIDKFSQENRVITLVRTKDFPEKFDNVEVMGFILLKDRIRSSAKDTLEFFEKQDVELKIISGDNVRTVANIARRAGLKNADRSIDATAFKTDADIEEAVEKYSVFGRVTPQQKKKIVLALKQKGHAVAMTGDGVNDVLALKEADCSVAMASGSDAARNVSQLVLLNSNFESMVEVVKEGRRSINNIQRSSSLFLVKTIYSSIIAIMFLFINLPYPFMPIQMTLVSVLTIGIPSFVLALEPNHERVKEKFFLSIISRAAPSAFTIVLNIVTVMVLKIILNMGNQESSTLCVMLAAITGFMLLYDVCRPFNVLRRTLFALMCCGFVFSVIFLKNVFSLVSLNQTMTVILLVMIALSYLVFNFLVKIFSRK